MKQIQDRCLRAMQNGGTDRGGRVMQEVGRCHAGGSEREAVVRSVFVETGEHHSAFFRAECTHP